MRGIIVFVSLFICAPAFNIAVFYYIYFNRKLRTEFKEL